MYCDSLDLVEVKDIGREIVVKGMIFSVLKEFTGIQFTHNLWIRVAWFLSVPYRVAVAQKKKKS